RGAGGGPPAESRRGSRSPYDVTTPSVAERPGSAAGPAGETAYPGTPPCRPGPLQQLVRRFHSLVRTPDPGASRSALDGVLCHGDLVVPTIPTNLLLLENQRVFRELSRARLVIVVLYPDPVAVEELQDC